MKTGIFIIMAIIMTFMLMALIGTFVSGCFIAEKCMGRPTARETATTVTPAEHPDKWELFIEALIQVESHGDATSVGKHDDVGVLQIRPCMVAEANRVLGMEVYSLDDRYSREKSIEMWNVVQGHHNPSRDVIKALKVHNPNAPKKYVEKVLNEFYKQVKGD